MDANSIFRWVAVLPAALGGAWLTYIVWMIIDRLVLVSQGFDPDSIIERIWTTVGSSGVMTIAFIWIGVTVAPAHKKNTAGIMGVLAIVIGGVLLLPAILVKDIWAILGCVAMIASSALTVKSFWEEEIDG